MLKRKYRWDDGWQQYVPHGWEEDTEAVVIVDGHSEPLEPLTDGPLAPEAEAPREAHAAPCACKECLAGQSDMTKGQRMADYLKASRIWDRGP